MINFISELSSAIHTDLPTTHHTGRFCSRIDTCSADFQKNRCSNEPELQLHWGCRAGEEGADFCPQLSQHPLVYRGAEFTPQL